ncbi:unannotated protein [freshwater metagenome]|uniref:Unannotated protein n=1 Tax=freshwater metagenome TaxID=449393 RepID=A0A6J7XTD7_9ZZZZ
MALEWEAGRYPFVMASLLALISSVLWGSADYHGGKLSKRFPAIAVLGISQGFGLIFGIFLVVTLNEFDGVDRGFLIPGALAGIAGYIGLICLYSGLSTGPMGVVSPISSLSAVIPLSIALVGGEVLTVAQAVGVVAALIGAFCASGPELSQGVSVKPLLLALSAALCFGAAMSLMAIGSRSSALLTMVMMRTVTLFISCAIAARHKTLGGLTRSETPLLIFIGVSDFLANLLMGVATTKGLISLVMVLASLYPIATALLAFKFLHERLMKVQYFGIILAVAGVALISAT